MAWYWYVGWGVAHGVFIFDLWLDRTGRRTISEYVWDVKLPGTVMYVASVAVLNGFFWGVAAGVVAGFLTGWLMGHFSPRKKSR
jgi:hypothetical protein